MSYFEELKEFLNSPYFALLVLLFFALTLIGLQIYSPGLNSIKSRRVGDGQYGDARFMTENEKVNTYKLISYEPAKWRKGINLPKEPGIIVGDRITGYGNMRNVSAYLCTDDNHCMIIGGSGIGKTTRFLYPQLEYSLACGISFLVTDTKGDVARNYAGIAQKLYGYKTPILDLRNPMQSAGDNIMHLVNKYIDLYKSCEDKKSPEAIGYLAKAEKYAKITSKTIVFSNGNENYGNNQFFYDGAEGLLTSVILLVAEFADREQRHIISVYQIVQDMFGNANPREDSEYKKLLAMLPEGHKAKLFAGAAMNAADSTMKSILSTALSRMNGFIDTEMEQILCFESEIDAESFISQKTAVFLIMPEEDPTKYFLVSLILQQLFREILSIADEHNGKLNKRVMFYLDEFGTFTKIEGIDKMFSAIRSRNVFLVPVIQGSAQLETNYGREGADNINNNCQMTMFSGFSPKSKDAEELSKALGNRTVMTGSVSTNKLGGNSSRTLQMMQQPLMSPDQIRTLKQGNFILMKTGLHPSRFTLDFYEKWGISLSDKYSYISEKREARKVVYANKISLENALSTAQADRIKADMNKSEDFRYGWEELFIEIQEQERYDWKSIFDQVSCQEKSINRKKKKEEQIISKCIQPVVFTIK